MAGGKGERVKREIRAIREIREIRKMREIRETCSIKQLAKACLYTVAASTAYSQEWCLRCDIHMNIIPGSRLSLGALLFLSRSFCYFLYCCEQSELLLCKERGITFSRVHRKNKKWSRSGSEYGET